jgi:ADP-heptose:LPS heptosyltransferase
MQELRFDLVLQLHGGGAFSNPFVQRLGARVTAGLRAPDAPPLDRTVPYVYYGHEIVRFLEVAALVGAPPVTYEPRLHVTAADHVAAAAALAGLADPVVVLHPGATDPRRHWPVDRFAAVGDELHRAGAEVVVTGSANERPLAARLAVAMHHPVRDLAGRLDLRGLVGVLERAAVVVSNDTGPRHVAEAVGTATVAVYWCGNLINAGPLTRARHRPHISWQTHCPECGADSMSDLYPARTGGTACRHRASFVSSVPVAEVLPDALDLLAAAAEAQDAPERIRSSSAVVERSAT